MPQKTETCLMPLLKEARLGRTNRLRYPGIFLARL
jgi:hypothetical protein